MKKVIKPIFFIVFLMVELCAALCATVFMLHTPTVFASASTTPRYTLTYDYEQTFEAYRQEEKTSSGTSTSANVAGNTAMMGVNSSNVFKFTIYLFGDNYSSSSEIKENNCFFNFSNVNIRFSEVQLIFENEFHESSAEWCLSIKNSTKYTQYITMPSLKSNSKTITDFFSGVLDDGIYELNVIFDIYGSAGSYSHLLTNISSTFTIDTVAPTINVSCGDNGFSKDNVVISYKDTYGISSAVYSRSTSSSYPISASTSFTSGTTFTEPGNYTVKVTDKAGNIATKHFTIDKTAPTLTLSGVSNGGFTNDNVSASWFKGASGVDFNCSNSNDNLTVKYSRSTSSSFPTSATTSYSSGTQLTTEGNYLMRITDSAGNSRDYTFTIDKTAPTLSLSGVSNGGFTNGNVSASWSTTVGNVGAQRTNSNDNLTVKYSRSTSSSFPTSATTSYSSGTQLTTEGNYLMRITDSAGNSCDYTFTIDKTAPTLSLSGVSNEGFTNGNVSASWSTSANGVGYNRTNNNDALTIKYSKSITSSFSTATTSYSSGTQLTEEGNYSMTITDSAGNSNTYWFTIDKTAPTLSLSGVSNEGFTNGNVSASWSTSVGGKGAQRTYANDVLTVKYSISNGTDFPSSAKTVYTSGAALTAEGNYRIEISDAAGNTSFSVFTIDKTAPTFTLRTSDSSSFINNRTSKDVSASWSTSVGGKGAQRTNANDVLTVKYACSLTSSFPESADEIYTAGQLIDTEGKYCIEISDAAGNVYSQEFEIYRQPPTFTVLSASGEELTQEPLAYNKDIKISFVNCTARLDGNIYTSGTLITAEGEHPLILTDELGNKTNTIIYIIKRPPTANLDRLQSPINRWYETTDTTGSTYSFASYDNAYVVADERERATITGGIWTATTWDGGVKIADEDLAIAAQGMGYYVYKSYDSASALNAYFSIASLNKAVEKYVLQSINIRYIPATPTAAASGEIVYRDIYFSKDAITFERINNCTLYVDGVTHNYPYTLTEFGQHSIFEVDIAGNSVSYTVIIDAAQPIVRVTNLNGNLPQALTYGTSNYFTYGIRIYLDDADDQAILQVNDDYYLGGVVELRAAGTYSIKTRDAAGNSGNLTIYISLIEPTITISENEVADVVNSFSVTISKNYNLNNINSLSILKYDEEEATWQSLTSDNTSPPVSINKNNLVYSFNVSGQYRIIVVDAFGRYLEKGYTFVQGSPKGILSTTGGTVLTSGDSTKNNFYFTWSNLLDCSAEISVNGGSPLPYTKGTIITNEGSYSIKLYSNVNDVSNVYEITIDKTAPFGVLTANGVELASGSTTRHAVSLSWEESGCTAVLNGEPYSNGSEVAEEGDYTIELTDRAGNKRTYTFRIKTTPPKIILSTSMGKIANYDVTKYDVYVSWTERNCTCLVNGTNYVQNTKINVENSYTVILTDAYGNSNSYFFSIDKTAPTGQLYVDGHEVDTSTTIYTNKKVNFTWSELGCSAVINDDFIYNSGSIISEDGTYTIKLSDKAGNVATYSFIIKTSAPSAKLLTNGTEVSSGARTKYEARLTWTESGCTATVNDAPYSKGALITAEGDYTFVLFDSYGNKNSWRITIDKTPPVITLTSNGEYISAGDISRFDVCYNWDDALATATLNGIAVDMGGVAEEEGEYTLIVVDDVGNKSSIVFIIDKTAKVGTLIANSAILENGAITRYSVYYTWNGSSYNVTLNGEPYSKGALITAEGDYRIELTDRAGNVSVVTFLVDKTPAEGVLYAVLDDTAYPSDNGVETNGNVYFEWEEDDCTTTLNGEPYSKGALITAEGDYRIELTDRAGNVSVVTFKIDKTAPRARAYTANNENIEDSIVTRYSIYFDWSERSCTATVNGEPYSKGALLSDTGIYYFELTDAVGNTTYISIEVYKVVPTAEIIPVNNFVLPYLNDGFSVTWSEDNCTATVNGQEYEKESIITEEGDYVFILTNKVGVEYIENISIDRTAPALKVFDADGNSVEGDISLKYIYFDWDEEGCTATVNGEPYKAKTVLTKDNEYTILLSDAAGNLTRLSVRVAREKPTAAIIKESGDELTNGGSTSETVSVVATSFYVSIKVDDEEYTEGTAISALGTHVVLITDEYGNTSEYSFTIKEASAARQSTNPFSKLIAGSSTGTILLVVIIVIVVVVCIVVPLIKAKKKGAFKKKLK